MPRANPAESLFAFGYSLDVGRICLKNNTSIILIIFRILFRIILKNLFYPGPSEGSNTQWVHAEYIVITVKK
jgi:hypothetical protein